MSEMEFEGAPEVEVPLVRNWLSPALRDWKRGCYPRRSGFFVVWGWLVFFWAFWEALKLGIYVTGVVLLIVAFLLSIPVQLVTYKSRYKTAIRAAWGPYMGELHEEGPQAA